MMFFDTDKEQQIGLGVSYPFSKMEPGECLISSDAADYFGLSEGATLHTEIIMEQNLMAMVDIYNQ